MPCGRKDKTCLVSYSYVQTLRETSLPNPTTTQSPNPTIMITSLAWRNVWRSKGRSLVVIAAVALGVWAILFTLGFSTGFIKSFINNGIQNQYSHIQIHHPKYPENKEIKYVIEGSEPMMQEIKGVENVKAVSSRVLVGGTLNSARGMRGVQVLGIDPKAEGSVTGIDQKMIDGKFLEGAKKSPIIIGKALAEELKLKVRSKIRLSFLNANGDMIESGFRVVGIYDTKMGPLDKVRVFVRQSDLQRELQIKDATHEIAVFVEDPQNLQSTIEAIQAKTGNQLVEGWRDIAPELDMIESQSQISNYVVMIIILLALIFGIINTMLMAVLERVRELGMLMAVGMNKLKVFTMIVVETIMLTLVGAPIGMFLGWLTMSYFGKKGLSLASYEEGLGAMGLSDFIYPALEPSMYIVMGIGVGITAILASLYPAYKAISLRPVEALRAI